MSGSMYSMLEKVLRNQLHMNTRINKIADAVEGIINKEPIIVKRCSTCRRGKVEGEPPRDLTADTLICANCGDVEYSQWQPKLDKADKDARAEKVLSDIKEACKQSIDKVGFTEDMIGDAVVITEGGFVTLSKEVADALGISPLDD